MSAYIGYTNLIESAIAITVTSAASGFPKENAYDWLTSDWWKAAAAGTVYFTIDMGSAVSVDCWGLAGHNLPDNSGTIKPQYSSDNFSADINDLDTAQTPGTNAPIFRKVTSRSARYLRFEIVGTGAANLIGQLFFGVALQLPSPIPPGFTPPSMARDDELATNVAEKGAFLGRSIERNGYELDLKQELVPESWIRTYWAPFAEHARTKPFFFSWNYETYPEEAVLAWAERQLPKPQYTQAGFMSFQIKGRALHVV